MTRLLALQASQKLAYSLFHTSCIRPDKKLFILWAWRRISHSSCSCSTGGWDASSIAASWCPPLYPVTGYEVYTSIYWYMQHIYWYIPVYTIFIHLIPSYTMLLYMVVKDAGAEALICISGFVLKCFHDIFLAYWYLSLTGPIRTYWRCSDSKRIDLYWDMLYDIPWHHIA